MSHTENPRVTRRGLALGTLAVGLGSSAACSRPVGTSASSQAAGAVDEVASFLARHGFTGKTVDEVVEALDRDPRTRPLPLTASVRATEVVFADDKGEVTAPLVGGQHYLAIAPFEVKTHECHFHDVGSCTGELSDQPLHVTVTDSKGRVLVDTDAVTYANGFVGFWVPRQLKGTVVVSCDNKRGQVSFSSEAKGATCLTNLQVN